MSATGTVIALALTFTSCTWLACTAIECREDTIAARHPHGLSSHGRTRPPSRPAVIALHTWLDDRDPGRLALAAIAGLWTVGVIGTVAW